MLLAGFRDFPLPLGLLERKHRAKLAFLGQLTELGEALLAILLEEGVVFFILEIV